MLIWVSDELVLSIEDKELAPKSLILFFQETTVKTNNDFQIKHVSKFNEVREELIISANDNDDAPESPISLYTDSEKSE